MSEIKVVIQLLCQHLNLLLQVNLKPENFRLAKFDSNELETIGELWNTLHKLCLALGDGNFIQEKESPELWVQLQLARRGYKSAEFYCLPTNKSYGSRELLLALTWVLAREDALLELTKECIQQSPLCCEYSDTAEEKVLGRASNPKINHGIKKFNNVFDEVDYALWLAARVRCNVNHILDAEQDRVKNTHKVHKASSGSCGLPHLSVFETKIVRDPALFERHMPRLLKLAELIDVHTKWTKKRNIFWEWMDSVIELKESKHNGELSLQPHQERTLAMFLEAARTQMSDGKLTCDPVRNDMTSNIPRFIISSCLAKSANSMLRKASSSDLLADMSNADNGIVSHACDWLARVDSELQVTEKERVEKFQKLHDILQLVTRRIGVVVIGDNAVLETESEDCSK